MSNEIQRKEVTGDIPKIGYGAWSEITPGGQYTSNYKIAGLEPEQVKNRIGQPVTSSDPFMAELAAYRVMIDKMNGARKFAGEIGKPERYEKITGVHFSELISEAGITPTFFAELYNTTLKRVMDWIDGTKEQAPHPAYVLLTLMAKDKRNIDRAQKATDEVTSRRRERV